MTTLSVAKAAARKYCEENKTVTLVYKDFFHSTPGYPVYSWCTEDEYSTLCAENYVEEKDVIAEYM